MESVPYKIVSDPARKLIVITFDQIFWDLEVAAWFRSEVLAAVAALRCAPGEHLVLVDLSNAMLQSQDVYQKMQMLVGSATARRIALVASSPLARMQTKRLQIRDDVVMFATVADAESWLFEPVRESVAA